MTRTVAFQIRLTPEEHREWVIANGGRKGLARFVRSHMNDISHKINHKGPYQAKPLPKEEVDRLNRDWELMMHHVD